MEIEAPFQWPKFPNSDADFVELMRAADAHLHSRGIHPAYRPIRIVELFSDAFGWEGNVLPDKALAELPGFDGDKLLAKAQAWFEQVYSHEGLLASMCLGRFAYDLGNTLSEVEVPIVYGMCEFFLDGNLLNRGSSGFKSRGSARLNLLSCVKGLTPGRLSLIERGAYVVFFDFFVHAYAAMNWFSAVRNQGLFFEAKADYDSAVASVLSRRIAQTRWASQQSVEKTLKGVLTLAKKEFPRGGKNGHDLFSLSRLLQEHLGVELSQSALAAASCSPAVRYGEKLTTLLEAVASTHAVIDVWGDLATSKRISDLTRVEVDSGPV